MSLIIFNVRFNYGPYKALDDKTKLILDKIKVIFHIFFVFLIYHKMERYVKKSQNGFFCQ